jgi:tetratricopeptide (TPR) repeat protein
MRNHVALLAWTLIVAGCGSGDRVQELQQQKMTLELIKTQNEQLATLMKSQKEQLAALKQKENDLRAAEKGNQDALQKIEREKESLEKLRDKGKQDGLADDTKAALQKGRAALARGDVDTAIAIFSEMIDSDPKAFTAFGNRGIALCLKGELDQGIRDITQAILGKPDNARFYYCRGCALASKGLTGRSIADLAEAIVLVPKLAPEDEIRFGGKERCAAVCHLIRGLQYFRQADIVNAVSDFNKTIQLDPNDHDAYFCRGLAYGEQGKYSEAVVDFSTAIRLYPKFARAYCNRALAYLKAAGQLKQQATYVPIVMNAEDYAKVAADLDQAIRLDEEYAKAYVLRGLLDNRPLAVSDLAKLDPKGFHTTRTIATKFGGSFDSDFPPMPY